MTRKAKKPAKRARKPKRKVVRSLEEALVYAQSKPSNASEWERKRWFWKRLWVAVFGE